MFINFAESLFQMKCDGRTLATLKLKTTCIMVYIRQMDSYIKLVGGAGGAHPPCDSKSIFKRPCSTPLKFPKKHKMFHFHLIEEKK